LELDAADPMLWNCVFLPVSSYDVPRYLIKQPHRQPDLITIMRLWPRPYFLSFISAYTTPFQIKYIDVIF